MDKPLLLDAVTGNSRMLAALDRRGELHYLFWPDIDRQQQVRRALLGVFLAGRRRETLWLSDQGWEHHQEYCGDAPLLRTSGVHHDAGVAFTCTDYCVPRRALFLRRIRCENRGVEALRATLLHYAALDLGGRSLLNCCFYHPGAGALVHYRERTVCAIGFDRPPSGYTCGRRNSGGSAHLDAADGRLEGRDIELGEVDAALACDLGVLAPGEAAEAEVIWSFASDRPAALEGLEEARRVGAAVLEAETRRFWEGWLAQGVTDPAGEETLDRLFRRSLVVLKLLSDAEHGGIIAAPETDPGLIGSGGYGYCWPRDAAWVATAFDEAGHRPEAEAFYRWTLRTQEPEGSWYQRYYCDGSLAPSWGLVQGDETASVVFGVFHHFVTTRDQAFARECWPGVEKAMGFLLRSLDEETGLPSPSIDLWEERCEESAYAAAAVYGACVAAAFLARVVGEERTGETCQAAADRLREAIPARLWHAPDGRFLRGVRWRIGREAYEELDRGLDASLLGLAVPFGVLSPRDPRMKATAEQIARHLENPRVGGIHRYEGDGYRGGNPWVLCTLWLGLYELAVGESASARRRLAWAADHRTVLDLLPEQVSGETGVPCWVIPLGWSHAMFVHLLLALRRRGVSLSGAVPP